jgi:septum site-determining protein MinC
MTLEPTKPASETLPPFELKGSLFTLTVMYLREVDRDAIARHLTEKVRLAPRLFNNTPLVIDLEALAETGVKVDFAGLDKLLRNHGMIPVGVRNGGVILQAAATLAGLPILPESRNPAVAKKPDKFEQAPAWRSKIVTQPVRSGQQIYASQGDLIVLGAVSAGAEVLADGNIHVYGPLRGRALAGVKGDTETRIFCQSLEAELVSIAGRYRVIEQLDATERGKPVQMYLVEDHLFIEPLSR